MPPNAVLFSPAFLAKLREWITTHHSVYPHLPPQGIYFESLVERAFVLTGWPRDQVILTHPNSPRADITVGTTRLSLKTETGNITRRNFISITKLCTTETGEWTSESLVQHALNHLSRYEGILMLRAIWERENIIDYQLLEIPLDLLRKMHGCTAMPVGRRTGRRSLGFDVTEGDAILFHIHFDGADGKCQLRGLRVDRCIMLSEWKQAVPAE
jgi:Type II site-specific deoxyribonuclease